MSKQAKRRRTGALTLGAPSDGDIPSAQNNNPSSSALSTRTLTVIAVPVLTTLCARKFVANIEILARNESDWQNSRRYLKVLPEHLVPKVFAMLRAASPTLLNHAFIVAYFLRGPSITMTGALPGVNKSTISAISTMGADLHDLVLSGFEKYPDMLFASLLQGLPSLRVLVLRGCTKVGPKTIHEAAKSCPHLKIVNLNYTSTTPASLLELVVLCTQLEVLKLAEHYTIIQTDATFAKFLAGIDVDFKLPCLRTLKIRQTSLTDTSLNSILSFCPNLKRLDLSFTPVRRPPRLLSVSSIPALEKLSLTSTRVASSDLLTVIAVLPQLRTLSLGALGGGQGSSAAIGNSSAMTMNDETLYALTDILENNYNLEDINLVGNMKLGINSSGDGALLGFVSRVGRKCKKLNLAGISSLRSSDLAGLMPEHAEQGSSPLQSLILNNTNVDDEAALYISSCPYLETLELAGTKITSMGLFPIIDACSKLENLDLTSCRAVPVVDRRRFFEVWEKEWRDK